MAAPAPFRVRIVERFYAGKPRGDYEEMDLGKVPNGGTSYEARMYDSEGVLRGSLNAQPVESMKATLVGLRPLLEGAVDTYLRPVSKPKSTLESKPRNVSRRTLERTFAEGED